MAFVARMLGMQCAGRYSNESQVVVVGVMMGVVVGVGWFATL